MTQQKGIGAFGSTALLVSSMTGPGLSTIPALFQQSGWLAPVFIFIIVAILSGCSALFVCEALSNIKGNEKFQSKVELTTIAQVYLGKKYHYVFQVLLYLALQAVNVTSIIIAAQTFDSMFITIFKGTCGLGVQPGGWFCVTDSDGITGNSPFPADDYYIFTFGYLLTAVLVIPLGFFSLVENIIVQMVSFIVLIAVLLQWCAAFGQEGLKTDMLPAIGPDSTMVLGIVIFNYSFITTIPSWVNSLNPSTNIHKCMWISVIISTIFYLILGILGAMAYEMEPDSDILSILSANGTTASIVTAYLFPVCALITSIPVFTIVIRDNLLRGDVCSKPLAVFLSNFLPWIICIKYEASVEPIPELEECDPKRSPAPSHFVCSSIKNPDDNDVRMYDPDDRHSTSIRRSSIKNSRISQVEGSVLAYSPNTEKAPVPTIVCNDVEVVEGSPPMYTPNGLKAPGPRRSNASSLTVNTTSTNGLGISHPSYDEKPMEISNSLTVPHSPEISQVPRSPSIRSYHSPKIGSAFSFKSSAITPVLEDIKEPVELEHFIAFESKPWFNPFYLALVSCTAMSFAIVFMIIYDLVYLGMGKNVFG